MVVVVRDAMNRSLMTNVALVFAAFVASSCAAAEIKLDRDNLAIVETTSIASGSYQIADHDGNGVLHVRGEKLVIDFQGATLSGAADGTAPDQFEGCGIVIEDSSDVVLKNATIRGFKVGVYARNCRNLTLQDCDFSDNWKQRLLSTPEAENGADWLFGHENDGNEWLRYGAAVYLDGCTRFALRGNRARRGQNGFCLVRSHDGAVYDNDCSFNSGWGVAMYRACRNQVAHNKFDWCIRGYSHGVYRRGQDSAGILVFEQCSDNVFAFNSATHGGDGFFLFAGLETLDETGEGGCNRNLVYGNDFSHASNNGIEATFSTGNRFIENIVDQGDHAIWAGYSYGSQFIGNKISRCNHGISIEHGSDNRIELNRFRDNGVAVNLWANDKPGFADKPYGRSHPCQSEGYAIARNQFHDNKLDVRLVNTSRVAIARNEFDAAPVAVDLSGRTRAVTIERNNIEGTIRVGDGAEASFNENYFRGVAPVGATSVAQPLAIDFAPRDKETEPPEVPGRQDAFLPSGAVRGLNYIYVDEWGPYDFAELKVTPARPVFWNRGELRLLGPPTPYRIRDVRGQIEIANPSGELPATLKIASLDHKPQAFSFAVELPQRDERLAVSGLLLFAEWDVKFYGWNAAGARQPPADWKAVIAGPVLQRRTLSRIDFAWGGGAPSDRVPADHFATVAAADIDLPAGNYELRTVSDDGVRLTIDGKTVIDNWTWHPPTVDTAKVELSAGRHALRIEHFEIDGVAQLQFSLRPAN